MAATIIDHPPVSTPGDEWAASTENPFTSKSQTAINTLDFSDGLLTPSQCSLASTPGLELPGAFPKEKEIQLPFKSSDAPSAGTKEEERTPSAALNHLADSAPPKTTADLQEAAKGYLPEVQAVFETAKAYLCLPQSVASVLPGASSTSATSTETETPILSPTDRLLDATSGATPVNISSVDFDRASTTALPPATRNASYTTDFSDSSAASKSLDPTSTIKPIDSAAGPVAITSINTHSIPGADSSYPTAPPVAVPSTNVDASSSFPTPPDSKTSTPTAGANAKNANSQDEFPLPRNPATAFSSLVSPTPPPEPTDGSTNLVDAGASTCTDVTNQADLNVSPTQAHVTSGTGVRARIPGTAPVSGTGAGIAQGQTPAESVISVGSGSGSNEISTPAPNHTNTDTNTHNGSGKGDANAMKSSLSSGGGNGGEKKEKGLSKFVHRIKDKLHHSKEGSN